MEKGARKIPASPRNQQLCTAALVVWASHLEILPTHRKTILQRSDTNAEKQTNSCWPRRGGKRAAIQIPSRQRVKSALGCLCEAGNFWESVCRWLKAHLDCIFSDKSSDPLLISVLLPTPSVYSSQTLI